MLSQNTKIINSNKKRSYIFLSLIIVFIIICFALNPKHYMQQTLYGLEVFAKNVFPSLFPFFVFTKILTGLNCVNDFAKHFGGITKKLYNTSGISAYALFMAVISGYPVGAKVVSELYKENKLTKQEVNRVITFTSTSGPLFIIGSVGVGMLNSFKCGLVMLLCHILASLINGLLYRNKDMINKYVLMNEQGKVISDFVMFLSINIANCYSKVCNSVDEKENISNDIRWGAILNCDIEELYLNREIFGDSLLDNIQIKQFFNFICSAISELVNK